ncbi:hypothetical protein C0J52_13231 [Blattella germanica]|nr:hypothetical protein C0J52_13231 [Blattella germanica]
MEVIEEQTLWQLIDKLDVDSILDPTIRMEQDGEQAIRVNTEKETIYRTCIPHFSERYNLLVNAWAVKGLLFGSRGTAYQWTADI